MSMIETYQEEQELVTAEPENQNFATVGEIYDDGVSLIFDGETAPTQKHYKVNSGVIFASGDRVRILKDSGTYVVEYPVGSPMTAYPAASDVENVTKSIGGKEIALIFDADGVTVLKAVEVTQKINGKLITDILETDGTTAKKASEAGDVTGKINGKDISSIFYTDGITVLKARDVTYSLNGKLLSAIFESNGTTVKKATAADSSPKLNYGTDTDKYVSVDSSGNLILSGFAASLYGSLGSASYPWRSLYTGTGDIRLGSSTTAKLGFFGTSPTSKQTVSKASTSATLAQVITVVNNLLTALAAYGLITSY